MNDHGEEFYERVAADLDRFADVSTDHLHDAMAREGLCQWLYTSGNPPAWSGDDQVDRLVAARICAGCPVAGECLEFELRTAGYATEGVWCVGYSVEFLVGQHRFGDLDGCAVWTGYRLAFVDLVAE